MTAPNPPKTSLRYSLLLLVLLPQILVWVLGSVTAWKMMSNYQEEERTKLLKKQANLFAQALSKIQPTQLRVAQIENIAHVIDNLEPAAKLRWRITAPNANTLFGDADLGPPKNLQLHPNTPQTYTFTNRSGLHYGVALLVPYNTEVTKQKAIVLLSHNAQFEEAKNARLALNILLVLAGLAVLCGGLLYIGVQRGLRPLHQLVTDIGALQSGRLQQITSDNAPAEIKAVANALNQMVETHNKNVDSEKRFINDAAHQLRTPLAGLISQAELAMKEQNNEKLYERIEKMLGAAKRSAHLVQQMLSLARSEGNNNSSSQQPKKRNYDLASIAREVAREWIPKSVVKNIDLGYEGLDTIQVRGNQFLMREAISNLIDNALTYAGADCVVTVTVQRIVEEGQPRAILEVTDDGIGVEADQLEAVFKRFWRAYDHKPGGCGLGLALVNQVAVMHGGQASAHSATPHGLIIRLNLPEATEPDAILDLPNLN